MTSSADCGSRCTAARRFRSAGLERGACLRGKLFRRGQERWTGFGPRPRKYLGRLAKRGRRERRGARGTGFIFSAKRGQQDGACALGQADRSLSHEIFAWLWERRSAYEKGIWERCLGTSPFGRLRREGGSRVGFGGGRRWRKPGKLGQWSKLGGHDHKLLRLKRRHGEGQLRACVRCADSERLHG